MYMCDLQAEEAQAEFKVSQKKLNLNLKSVSRKFRRLETRISTVLQLTRNNPK